MGHNSQIALTLGRRPRAAIHGRGTQTLATVTACTTPIRLAATRSAPLSVSAKRDMSMINQRIVVKHAVDLINILVPAQIKLEVAEPLVVESIRLVLALADISGVLVVVLADVFHLMYGMEVVVFAVVHINILVPVQTKPEAVVWPVVENMRLVLARVGIIGIYTTALVLKNKSGAINKKAELHAPFFCIQIFQRQNFLKRLTLKNKRVLHCNGIFEKE